MSIFSLKKNQPNRVGILTTPHGKIPTPIFMPIATKAAVKNITPTELLELNTKIILSNTYHLFQRPGLEILKKHHGLHNLMNWQKPILTDSGGFQVFSLAKRRKITDEGVEFLSEIDGKRIFLTPEKVIDIQLVIGSDILMILDECPPYPCSYEYAKKSLDTTLLWARRSKEYFDKKIKTKKIRADKKPLIFGIIQGSTFKDLREKSVIEMTKLNFDGYAVGGVAVGESKKDMTKIVSWTAPLLPQNKPRYLMGVGKPEDIDMAIKAGIDMFDCVIPTREARHGQLYCQARHIKNKFSYRVMKIKNEQYKFDKKPIDKDCSCYTCKNFSRSYLRHLFKIDEGLALRLATLHNINFYLKLTEFYRQ